MVENIYVFIGEMGSGKTTIVEALSKELNIPIVKTTTSRPMRDNEDKNSYNFVDDKYFEINKDGFIETRHYDTIYGRWYYGLEYSSLEEINYNECLLILTPSSYKNLLNMLSDDIKIKLFYIYLSEEDRLARTKARGDLSDEITRRIEADKIDFKNVLGLNPIIIDNTSSIKDTTNKIKVILGRN